MSDLPPLQKPLPAQSPSRSAFRSPTGTPRSSRPVQFSPTVRVRELPARNNARINTEFTGASGSGSVSSDNTSSNSRSNSRSSSNSYSPLDEIGHGNTRVGMPRGRRIHRDLSRMTPRELETYLMRLLREPLVQIYNLARDNPAVMVAYQAVGADVKTHLDAIEELWYRVSESADARVNFNMTAAELNAVKNARRLIYSIMSAVWTEVTRLLTRLESLSAPVNMTIERAEMELLLEHVHTFLQGFKDMDVAHDRIPLENRHLAAIRRIRERLDSLAPAASNSVLLNARPGGSGAASSDARAASSSGHHGGYKKRVTRRRHFKGRSRR